MRAHQKRKTLKLSLCLGILLSAAAQAGGELTVATWNIAWLGDGIEDEKLKGNTPSDRYLRDADDYARLRAYAESLKADIVALQEIENLDAAKKVFPGNKWNIYISSRKTNPKWAQKTAVAVRNGLRAEKRDDVRLSESNNLRYGVDLEIDHAGKRIRILAIHLKSGCFSGALENQKKNCSKLAAQLPYLEGWIDARAQEGVPFIIAGDWNRRLATPEDEVWEELNDGDPDGLKLLLTASGHQSKCWNSKFPKFIDHVVLGGPASGWFKSFEETVYKEDAKLKSKLSDHCPVSVRLSVE